MAETTTAHATATATEAPVTNTATVTLTEAPVTATVTEGSTTTTAAPNDNNWSNPDQHCTNHKCSSRNSSIRCKGQCGRFCPYRCCPLKLNLLAVECSRSGIVLADTQRNLQKQETCANSFRP